MVFNSLVFLAFLAIVLPIYYRAGHRKQNILLVCASYVFYGWWDWRFLGLLLFTTLFDYFCALRIESSSNRLSRKWLVAASMAVNLGVLGFFKYFDFFAESFAGVLGSLGMNADFPTLNLILPLGISFYTFLSMSYTIDVYRGQLKAARNPLDFMAYVSFFPNLVAGPIVKAKDLLPQCQAPRKIRQAQVLDGIWLCLLGYVKKVVIADQLAHFVDWGFSSGQAPYPDASSWIVLYAFAFQIYGDFSGYSDIARGLAKLMGFELVRNFKAPYLVSNPADFWKNWHISLSVWLRDYLYIPLGGNRLGKLVTFRNLMLTMLLGGLWHGAGIAFLAWGLYHGLLLVIHRAFAAARPQSATASGSSAFRSAITIIVFFHITCIGWLLFRSGSIPGSANQWEAVTSFLGAMFRMPPSLERFALIWPVALLGGAALVFQWKHREMECFSQWSQVRQSISVAAALAVISCLGIFEGSSFIYFQF